MNFLSKFSTVTSQRTLYDPFTEKPFNPPSFLSTTRTDLHCKACAGILEVKESLSRTRPSPPCPPRQLLSSWALNDKGSSTST